MVGEKTEVVQERFNQFVSNCVESDEKEPTLINTVTDPGTSTVVNDNVLEAKTTTSTLPVPEKKLLSGRTSFCDCRLFSVLQVKSAKVDRIDRK